MNYEQKYKEALKRAKEWMAGKYGHYISDTPQEIAEFIFPELRESEDERTRKEIISFLKEFEYDHYRSLDFSSWIAWLEKQSEQRHTGKVEPKFHEGDFIKHNKANLICKVISVNSGSYCVENIETSCRIELFYAEQKFHLWTIKDAKEGDVLAWDNSKCIALFESIFDEDTFNSHGFVGHCSDIFEPRQGCHNIEGAHPATKEQRELLFAKMKEAGYEWDAKKKELKKL